MPSTTKTQDRLLASIRKAKSTSTAEPATEAPTPAEPAGQATEPAPKPAAKPAAKPRTAAPRTRRVPAARSEASKPEPKAAFDPADTYQRFRRVWPD